MTDRLNGFIVTLETPMRDDDAESVLNAIRMVKCVLSVKPLATMDTAEFVIRQQVKAEMRAKLWDALDD